MMKTSILACVALTALVVLWPRVTSAEEPPSKRERFGVELEACKEAIAAGKPSKCKLYGKIQLVDHFPDVKVQKVDHFPDIKVKWVDHFPDKPGKWQKVDHFPDYKVQFVDHFPDYKIQIVDHFPGC